MEHKGLWLPDGTDTTPPPPRPVASGCDPYSVKPPETREELETLLRLIELVG